MEKKIKIGLIIITIGIILLCSFIILDNYRQIGKLQYTVIELPEAKSLEMYAKPCMMIYWDNVTAYYDKATEEFDKPVSISLGVGNVESPEDVVDKWTNNVAKLERIYKDSSNRYEFHYALCGTFLWSNKPKTIKLSHRTSEGGYYLRDGWYIFTKSPSLLEEGNNNGNFFLSDEGMLMPVQLIDSRLSCP